MQFEPNEFFRLAMALGLAPVVYVLARRLRLPSARWPFGVMYGAFTIGYLMTVLEDFAAPDLFNALQHACSMVGAVAFALCARAVHHEFVRARSLQ